MGGMPDASNGYESIAADFIATRTMSMVGTSTVHSWTEHYLRPPASVLDVGCGCGLPITKVLVDAGLDVYALDASPSLIAAFRASFPQVSAECNTVEGSTFFDRTFDAVNSWGLIFLLPEESQHLLIRNAGAALQSQGRFLFTAPAQTGTWQDAMTGQTSISLGRDVYIRSLQSAGFTLVEEMIDEGDNHYYHAIKN
jgi:2-polyprenyl-3-methyl-5-hydroxy-6-metoxy-1,4-benzoquinol methylase